MMFLSFSIGIGIGIGMEHGLCDALFEPEMEQREHRWKTKTVAIRQTETIFQTTLKILKSFCTLVQFCWRQVLCQNVWFNDISRFCLQFWEDSEHVFWRLVQLGSYCVHFVKNWIDGQNRRFDELILVYNFIQTWIVARRFVSFVLIFCLQY